jgi:hypothetical protein
LRKLSKAIALCALVGVLALVGSWNLWPRPSVRVPTVVGMELRQAQIAIQDAGLKPKVEGYDCLAPGLRSPQIRKAVIAQRPDARAHKGSVVELGIGVVGIEGDLQSCWNGYARDLGRDARSILLFCVPLVFAFVAAYDMGRRGQRGWLWGLFLFFLFPVGLVVWLWVRRSLPLRVEAPSSAKELEETSWL